MVSARRRRRAVDGVVTMTVKMGDVWDRTGAILSGRGSTLAMVAALTIFLPAVVRDAYVAYADKGTPAFALIGGVLTIAVLLIALWGQLVILALASDPAVDRAGAQAQAGRRIGPAIGVSVLLMLALIVLSLPIVVAMAGAGVDWTAMANGGTMAAADIGPGRSLFIVGYGLLLAVAILFIGARLTLVTPVILHERRGAGAIGHSWALTRGHSWRIVGVLLLFLIVLLVAVSAAQAVTGIVFGLILGAEAVTTVALLAGIAAGIVSTIFTVIALAFIAQLYAALSAHQSRRQPVQP